MVRKEAESTMGKWRIKSTLPRGFCGHIVIACRPRKTAGLIPLDFDISVVAQLNANRAESMARRGYGAYEAQVPGVGLCHEETKSDGMTLQHTT